MTRILYLLALICLCFQTFAKKVIVGGSGGTLNYPTAQTTLALSPGDTIAIQPGIYSGLNFSNLTGSAQKKIVIINNKGLVEITSNCGGCSSNLTNSTNVVFTGSGAAGVDYGFYFHNISYRALQLNGKMDSTTISYCKFENVVDNTVRINNASVTYTGAPGTLVSGIKLLHLHVKNCGNAVDCGNFTGASDLVGITRALEIAYCRVDSCQGGEAFRLNKVFEADVHHNVITNMGLSLSSSHPGIVFLRGDGSIHHNYVHNVWGVCARGFGAGLNGTGSIYVYDNLFLGSRKYSSVEAQTFSSDMSSGTTMPYITICNYYVYNNTMGNQSAADFTSAMVDVYSLQGGMCQIKNNLGFNIQKDKTYNPSFNYIYNLEAPNLPDTSNNIYRPHFTDIGLADTVDCYLMATSIAINKGAALAMITDDYSGISRPQGPKPDIGAREFSSITTEISAAAPRKASVNLFPNPGNQSVTVHSDQVILKIRLADSKGQQVYECTSGLFKQDIQLPVDHLQEGVYLITIECQGYTTTEIFMKF